LFDAQSSWLRRGWLFDAQSSWLPQCLQLSPGNWEEAVSRHLWAPLGARGPLRHFDHHPPLFTGLVLRHFDHHPPLFTLPVWRAVGALVRDAKVVVIR
jgi:hypothetical protein